MVARFFCLLILGLGLASCCVPIATEDRLAVAGQVSHVILVRLHTNDAPSREKLIATSKSFVGKIPGLRLVTAGQPLPSNRPFVQSDFDLGIYMLFDSPQSLAHYNTHPLHKQAVQDVLKPLAKEVRVYDFTHE